MDDSPAQHRRPEKSDPRAAPWWRASPPPQATSTRGSPSRDLWKSALPLARRDRRSKSGCRKKDPRVHSDMPPRHHGSGRGRDAHALQSNRRRPRKGQAQSRWRGTTASAIGEGRPANPKSNSKGPEFLSILVVNANWFAKTGGCLRDPVEQGGVLRSAEGASRSAHRSVRATLPHPTGR